MNHLIKIKFGMGTLENTNHLRNKCISSVADLFQDQLGLALVRLDNVVQETICSAIRHKLISLKSILDVKYKIELRIMLLE